MRPDCTISEMISEYKNRGDDGSIMCIVNRMEPLIKKYARMSYFLEYEDAYQEFTLALLESVHRIEEYAAEKKVVKYLATGVKNKFLELYRKRNSREQEVSCDMQAIEYKLSFGEKFCDIEFYVDMKLIMSIEKSILKRKIAEHILYYETTDTEIAKKLNVSRQYVNRCKKEIFKKLSKY